QELLEQFYGKPKTDRAKKYHFILSGALKCGTCGEPLVGRSSHGNGGRYPYYDHGWTARKQQVVTDKSAICSCNPRRISAPVAERLAQLPKEVPAEPINAQMTKLNGQKSQEEATLSELEAKADCGERVARLDVYREFADTLRGLTQYSRTDNPTICRGIIQKL